MLKGPKFGCVMFSLTNCKKSNRIFGCNLLQSHELDFCSIVSYYWFQTVVLPVL